MTKRDAKRLLEARAAITRLEHTLEGNNRFGAYEGNVRAAIARHKAVIAEIAGDDSAATHR